MSKIKNPLINYENKWVALNSNYSKVVESADTFESLKRKLDKVGRKKIVVTKVLPFDTILAPNVKA